jgi:hypothetical protein
MKKCYTSLLLLLPFYMQAQPVITKMEQHSIGTSLVYGNTNSMNIAPGPAGANQTWDFSGLFIQDTTKQWILPVSSTSHSTHYPNATAVRKILAANTEIRYEFTSATAAQTLLLGFVDSLSGNVYKFPNPALYAIRPISYMTSQTDTYTTDYIMTTTLTGVGTIKISGDGYGTLKLPGKTYNNVLRVKMELSQNDSGSIGPQLYTVKTTNLSYVWYDTAHKAALMKWDSTSIVSGTTPMEIKNISYLLNESFTGIEHRQTVLKDANAWINGNKLVLEPKLPQGHTYEVVLFNVSGQQVYASSFVTGNGLHVFDLGKEPGAGMYLVCLQDKLDGSRYTIKLAKQ